MGPYLYLKEIFIVAVCGKTKPICILHPPYMYLNPGTSTCDVSLPQACSVSLLYNGKNDNRSQSVIIYKWIEFIWILQPWVDGEGKKKKGGGK